MELSTSIDLVVARLRQESVEIRPLLSAPWIDDFEVRLGLCLPPAFRSLVRRHAFPLLDIGEVELFANQGDGAEDDLAIALFRDPRMSPWLIRNRFIHVGHPNIGNYDPVCFDLSATDCTEPPVVLLSHEDILLERKSVRRKVLADCFLSLFWR